jgi:parallel beta-helix repeat protein
MSILLSEGLRNYKKRGRNHVQNTGTSGRGPQSSIVPPTGSVFIPAGSTTASRQTAINANPVGTTFALGAGTHTAEGVNTPKNSNTFVGEYGAIIDGTGWVSSTDTDAAFGHLNGTATNVTFKNLTIRNVPQRAIQAYPWNVTTGWLVEYCDIHTCADGIVPGNNAIIRNNLIHDCYRPANPNLSGSAVLAGGNFNTFLLSNIQFINNEMYNFGGHQKMLDATGMVWRDNYIHHADGPGIWNDGYGDGFLAEGNLIEDCGRGIHWELSFGGTIRNNTIRRSADQAVYVSTSRNTEIYNNIMEDNFRAIAYFVNCDSIGQFAWDTDTRDNYAHHNTIKVPNTANVLANFFSYSGACDVSAYLNNSKNNDFDFNAYRVPSLTGFYWLQGGGLLDWTAWRAVPQDTNGTVTL